MKLYHLTDKKIVPIILEQGLVPMIGKHSKIVGDCRCAVYLTDFHSVPTWNAFFGGGCALLEVDIPDDVFIQMDMDAHMFGAAYADIGGDYKELSSDSAIPPEFISVYDGEMPTMDDGALCGYVFKFIRDITSICVDWARIYKRREMRTLFSGAPFFAVVLEDVEIALQIGYMLKVLKTLDFSMLTEANAARIFRMYSETGRTCFTDTVGDGGERLCDMLCGEDNETTLSVSERRRLFVWMRKTFGSALQTDTGFIESLSGQ